MTKVRKTIGRVPLNFGDYDPNEAYGKRNRVNPYGCEWESKIENNTYAPATLVGGVVTPDTTHWNLTSGIPGNYGLVNSKGQPNGIASLDSSGKVPAGQLPSYVDDVIEGYYYDGSFYSDAAHQEELTPESDKIYIDLTSDKSYRWTGSVYSSVSNPYTADDEDLTVQDDKLKLADKAYDSASFSGDAYGTIQEHP